jgi:Xaa-Pro aminopeptidase
MVSIDKTSDTRLSYQLSANNFRVQDHQLRLRAAIADHGLDAALIVSPAGVSHASGVEAFLPLDAGTEFAISPTVVLLPADDQPAWVLVPEAHARRATEQAEGAVVESLAGFGHFEPVDARRALAESVSNAWHALGRPQRIGYEPRWLPAGWVELSGLASTGVTLVDAAAVLEGARAVKSVWEIARIQRSAAAADAAQRLLAATDLVGRNELSLWGELLGAAAAVAGHEVTAFADLVTGSRTGTLVYPGGPIDRVIDRGDTVILDFSVRVDGYWADCTSTAVAGGEPNSEQLRHFHASRDAFDAAVACLRPGRQARDAENAAREALAAAGIEAMHYAGHQIGASVNEPPRLVPYDETEIRAGMVFAVEPGGYNATLGVGARSEKVVLVTDDGPEILSDFPWPLAGRP